jgi:hypothetical protein
LSDYVRAIATKGSDVFVGGDFLSAGGRASHRIAKWDGSHWTPLGSGMDKRVNAVAVWGTNVYAGGDFTNADGKTAGYIAAWNGNEWNAVGSGLPGTIRAFAVCTNYLYAGGAGVAQWDGDQWTTLSSLFVNSLLLTSDTNLYAGTPNGIMKWNGSGWVALGTNSLGTRINTLAEWDNYIYAGGSTYDTRTGSSVWLSKWDGTQWIMLLNPSPGSINASVVAGGRLYMADSSFVLKWNGSNWETFGSGLNQSVLALAASADHLYAGGAFNIVGGEVSAFIAKADIRPSIFVARNGSSLVLHWDEINFFLQTSTNVAGPYADVLGAASPYTNALTGSSKRYFRLRQ